MSKVNYKQSRIFIIIFCSIFMTIGAIAFLLALLTLFRGSPNWFILLWGAGFFLGPFYIMRTRLKQIATFEKMTYQWYISENSKFFNNGRVSCCNCGETRIHVRNLMNQTFHREHFCAQCGKTLYYSPE
jgi:hypothetical protein